MKGPLRGVVIVFGVLFALTVALAYPVGSRPAAWLAATWENWYALFLLPIVPLSLLMSTVGQDRTVPRFRIFSVAPFVKGPRGVRSYLRDVPGILRAAALALGILALARPQNVLRGEESEERGIDIVLVLDLSGSMRALMDGPGVVANRTPGQPATRLTRLETAKEVILDFIGRRKSDRIGVVVFGRSAYILSPPTLDKTLLFQLVSKIDLDVINGNGTAIGDAVGTATARLRRSAARSKAVILLTDGDSNSGSIEPDYASHLAQEQGVRVFTVQIGNGDEVDVQNGTDIFGQPNYVRAHFPVNPDLLKRMAAQTGGESFVATDKAALEQSMHSILDRLEKTRFSAQSSTVEDLFPLLLIPFAALVALEALLRVFVLRRYP
jgi:Ca-activated chloride channel family protein